MVGEPSIPGAGRRGIGCVGALTVLLLPPPLLLLLLMPLLLLLLLVL